MQNCGIEFVINCAQGSNNLVVIRNSKIETNVGSIVAYIELTSDCTSLVLVVSSTARMYMVWDCVFDVLVNKSSYELDHSG